MELNKVVIQQHGPICEHNMPCAVCIEKVAVWNMSLGYFEPCWGCQKKGFYTKRAGKFWLWLLVKAVKANSWQR